MLLLLYEYNVLLGRSWPFLCRSRAVLGPFLGRSCAVIVPFLRWYGMVLHIITTDVIRSININTYAVKESRRRESSQNRISQSTYHVTGLPRSRPQYCTRTAHSSYVCWLKKQPQFVDGMKGQLRIQFEYKCSMSSPSLVSEWHATVSTLYILLPVLYSLRGPFWSSKVLRAPLPKTKMIN